MKPADPRPPDRRRYPRRDVMATAAVFSHDRLHGMYWVHDLSAGGASLVGSDPLPLGETVTVLLQFPGRSTVTAQANVLRDLPGFHDRRCAIAFVRLRPEDEDTINEAILSALDRQRARFGATVLVIDNDDGIRDALERDLRSLGHDAVGVATPLEALTWIERPGGRISTVLIDVAPGPTQGLEVLEFLGECHPEIRRVVMCADRKPFRLDIALRSGRAHQVLRKPWDRDHLSESVGPPNRRERLPRGQELD